MMSPFPLLPPQVYRYVMRELLTSLPPPMDADPQTQEDRDVVVMAAVRRLYPINTTEARVAVVAVASQTQAMDCLRLAGLQGDNLKVAAQCRAQAALMMRTSVAAMKELRTLQAMRPSLPAELLEPEEAVRRTSTASVEAGAADRRAVSAESVEADRLMPSDEATAPIIASREGATLADDTRGVETVPTPSNEAARMVEQVAATHDGHGDRSAPPAAPKQSRDRRHISGFRDYETESGAAATDPAEAPDSTAPMPRTPVLAPLGAGRDGHSDPGDTLELAEPNGRPIGPAFCRQSVTVTQGGLERSRRGTETPHHRRDEQRDILPGLPIGLRPSDMDGLAAEAVR